MQYLFTLPNGQCMLMNVHRNILPLEQDCVLFLPSSLYFKRTQLCDWSYIIFFACSDAYNSNLPVRARKNLLNSAQRPMLSWVAGIHHRDHITGAMLRFSSTICFECSGSIVIPLSIFSSIWLQDLAKTAIYFWD